MIGRLSDFLAQATSSSTAITSIIASIQIGAIKLSIDTMLYSASMQCINMSSRPRHLPEKVLFLKSCQNILYEVIILSLLLDLGVQINRMFAPRSAPPELRERIMFRGQLFRGLGHHFSGDDVINRCYCFYWKKIMEKYSDFKLGCVGFFFYPQKVFMLYYTQFFFSSRFFREKGSCLKNPFRKGSA